MSTLEHPSIRKSGKQRPLAKRGSLGETDNPCNALHIACLEGNDLLVSNLLSKASYDINAPGEGLFTSLHFAANVGCLSVGVYCRWGGIVD